MMEENQIYEEPMEEATMQESVVEGASTGDICEEPQIPWQRLLGELMPNDQLDETLMESHLSESSTPETPMEEDSITEASTPETPTTAVTPGTQRQPSRRPPRWLQATGTQSKLARALHTYRLESEITDYSMNREEIQEFGRLETRRFLTGPRLPPPMDAAARIEAHFNGDAVRWH